jgi:ABC-type polysaccharide/polyol phosphate export permease
MNTAVSHSYSPSIILDFFYQLFRYREYLKQSVMRDLRTKYKRSILGYLWTMLHPLGMMAILAIVFSRIMGVGVKDYAVFVFCGLLPWGYFNSTAMMSLGSIRANARLFNQVPIPKYIFIISIALSNLVNFLLALVPLILIMLVTGRPIYATVLAFPIILLPVIFVVVGISLLLAASNVFFDDTLHLSEVALQGLYFLTPILYDRKQLPPELLNIVVLNPLFCQIEFIRGIFYDGVLPDPATFAISFFGSLVILLLSLKVFMKVEDKFLYFI